MSASFFTPPPIGATTTVFKSGPLFISSKGLGWKSWKKRWFILTRTSLVFFKNDSTRAVLEEIVIAEADVARLKQKVAELHQQLYQQRHHHYGYLSDASDRYQHLNNHNSQQRGFQQDFDSTIAYINHERKQRSEETSLWAELRNIKGQTLMNGNTSRPPTRGQFLDTTRLSDSKSIETSTSLSKDDYASMPSIARPTEVIDYSRNLLASSSSTLVELTTRLDFFKERRSQLMEQLHNLDLSYTSPSQEFAFKQPGRNILKIS